MPSTGFADQRSQETTLINEARAAIARSEKARATLTDLIEHGGNGSLQRLECEHVWEEIDHGGGFVMRLRAPGEDRIVAEVYFLKKGQGLSEPHYRAEAMQIVMLYGQGWSRLHKEGGRIRTLQWKPLMTFTKTPDEGNTYACTGQEAMGVGLALPTEQAFPNTSHP